MNNKLLFFIAYFSINIVGMHASQAMQYPAYVNHCNQEIATYTSLQTTYCEQIDGGFWYALYNGHSGDNAALYLKDNLHQFFATANGSIKEKFQGACFAADHGFKQNNPTVQQGASCSIVFIKDNIAHCAYLGNCYAFITNDENILFSTEAHDSNNANERKRITQLVPRDETTGIPNGNHFDQRDGSFSIGTMSWSVTRSIGDSDGYHVTCIPEYHAHKLEENDTCIFLATKSFVEKFNQKKASNTNIAKEIAQLHDSNDIKRFGNSYPHDYYHQTMMIIDLKNKIINAPWWKNNIKLLVGSGICAVILGMIVKKYYK